jgi:hypothetical protein
VPSSDLTRVLGAADERADNLTGRVILHFSRHLSDGQGDVHLYAKRGQDRVRIEMVIVRPGHGSK